MVNTDGGDGGVWGSYTAGGAANKGDYLGAPNSTAAGPGTSREFGCGDGGGGGAAFDGTVSMTGGNGGTPGGGGGGGGAGWTAAAGGTSGTGARGEVRIWAW